MGPPGWAAGQPSMMPPTAPPGHNGPVPPPFADPHLRVNPTATGGRLNLAPWEVPTDRVIELSKQLEVSLAQNQALLNRIKELEALGAGREQALLEASREIDLLAAANKRDRAAFQAQIVALQGRIKQLEEEDIIFLRAVIDALGRLLPPEKKP
jgi:hypothetical protein